jgi:class 3 adenylate cyclase/YHS domain-containing protein
MAADVIDKYLEIVDKSLVGNSVLHERVGDEILVVSPDPNELLLTASVLLQNVSMEENFLLLHGGLHFGKLLKRNSGYFGSALNLTARIASIAKAGSFYCSQEFVEAVAAPANNFQERGIFSFKNVSEEKQIFELVTDKSKVFRVDPVCRMVINSVEGAFQHPLSEEVYFCSRDCLEAYLKLHKV